MNNLTIRTILSENEQAMLALDLDFIAPIGRIPVASLMTFNHQIIIKIELFYDARQIIERKSEIFS